MAMKTKPKAVNLIALRKELKEFEEQFLSFSKDKKLLSASDLKIMSSSYQQLVSRYGYLETFLPGTKETAEALRLLNSGRRALYGSRLASAAEDQKSFFQRLPLAFSLLWPYCLFSFAIACVGGLLAVVLISLNPEFAWNFVNEETAERLQNGQIWTDQIRGLSSLASSRIATNNITVTFNAFALGVTAGIGTAIVLFFNGWHIAGLFAITSRYEMGHRLLEFILAHGFLELSIIFVAGGCGLYLGDAIIHPGHQTRKQSLQTKARPALDLVLFGALCLIPCGFVEGYISPSTAIPLQVKLLIGLSLGFFYWSILLRKSRAKKIQARFFLLISTLRIFW